MENELEALRQRVLGLEASRTAHHMVLAALMQTYPRHDDLQLWLTTILEQQIPNGALGQGLDPGQQRAARAEIEALLSNKPIGERQIQDWLASQIKPLR